ncbi:unnamed protein product, partial [Iphiclides podalirius]
MTVPIKFSAFCIAGRGAGAGAGTGTGAGGRSRAPRRVGATSLTRARACRMHAVGLHSALAIRRERKRRAEQQRARERRYSLQSTESGVTSPHCSTGSLERRRAHKQRPTDNEVVSSVGMLHLGVVFLVLGFFLVGSGWLPDDVTSWSSVGSVSWFNELVCSGLFALGIGVFLVALHKYLTKSEEDALEDYVQRQLTRSRSGHRLERDAETGGMHTKNARRARASEPPRDRSGEAAEAAEAGAQPAHGFVNALAANGDAVRDLPLEQIAEEEASVASEADRRLASFNRDTYSQASAAASLSPGSPSDTRELLSDGRYMVMSRM